MEFTENATLYRYTNAKGDHWTKSRRESVWAWYWTNGDFASGWAVDREALDGYIAGRRAWDHLEMNESTLCELTLAQYRELSTNGEYF